MVSSVSDLFMDIRHKLSQAGISAFDLEAKELICAAMGVSPQNFSLCMSKFVAEDVCDKAYEFAERRINGEPCAYILGEWDFYGLTFNINKNVLIPRPDTETLVDVVLSLAVKNQKENIRILDLCTGSGCRGSALAVHIHNSNVVLADFSEDALVVASQNIKKHELEDRIQVIKCNALEYADEDLGKFDIIVSNPPYISSDEILTLDNSVKDFEPKMALDGGNDGLKFYRAISRKWKKSLNEGGILAFEAGYTQANDIVKIMADCGYNRIETSKDLSGITRVVCGTAIEQKEEENNESL